MLFGRIVQKIASRGKVTASVRLLPKERSVFGMTVVLRRKVMDFQNPEVFLRLPWGIDFRLPQKDYTLVRLTQGAFPGECKASISVYLTRQGIASVRKCPEGCCLVLRFRTSPKGRGRVEVIPRRPIIYSKTTEYTLENTLDL